VRVQFWGEDFSALTPVKPALSQRSVLIKVGDVKLATALGEAVISGGLRANFCSSADTARKLIEQDPPSLAIIDEAIAQNRHLIFSADLSCPREFRLVRSWGADRK